MDEPGIGPIAALLMMFVCLVLNALFVAAEFALISVRRSQIKKMLEEGAACGSLIESLKNRQERSIAGAQLGITLASLAIGWLGEESIHKLVLGGLQTIPGLEFKLQAAAIVLSFLIMSVLHVVIGEQVPKVVALLIPIKIMQILALPFRLFCFFTAPLIWLMGGITALVLIPFGLRARGHGTAAIDQEEYQHLFAESEEAGNLGHEDALLLQRALEWRDLLVQQAMRPRNKVDFISRTISLPELLAKIAENNHSKLPVFDGTSDKIVGVLHTRDIFKLLKLLAPSSEGEAVPSQVVEGFDVMVYVREAHFAPESMDARALFEDMRAKKYQIAIVTDEFGGTAGIVTQEDLLERLVGDIEDEHDEGENQPIRKDGEDTWVIRGDTLLVTVNQALELPIESPTGQTTIAGAVIEVLDRQPGEGDLVEMHGFIFTVAKVTEQTLTELRVQRKPVAPESKPAAEGT